MPTDETFESESLPTEQMDIARFRALQSIVTSLIQTLHENDILPREKVFTVISQAATKANQQGRQIEAFLMEKYVARIRDISPDA